MSHKHNTQTFRNGWFIPFQFWFLVILRHQAGWGHAMARICSGRPVAAETQDKSQASTHEIFGGKNLVFLSVLFHQCERFNHLSLTIYNHRNQWHCKRTSLKNNAGWCRGHILDMCSGWTWIGSSIGCDSLYPGVRFFMVFLSLPMQLPV